MKKTRHLVIAVLVIVAILFILCPKKATAQSSTTPTKKTAVPAKKAVNDLLTVEQVVQLVQSGLAEDLIVGKIRKNGKAFDLSTGQLLQLKKVGASDNLIRVLMDPKFQSVSAPSAPIIYSPDPKPTPAALAPVPEPPVQTPATPKKLSVPIKIDTDPTSINLKTVKETGFYLLKEGGMVSKISPTAFRMQKVRGTMKMVGTFGLKKAQLKAVLEGLNAPVSTPNKRPQFLFNAPEGVSPTEYLVLKLDLTKEGTREVGVGTRGIAGSSGFDKDAVIPFFSVELGGKKYIIRFYSDLSPGEYCFYPASGLQLSGALGENVSAVGKLYDFGVK